MHDQLWVNNTSSVKDTFNAQCISNAILIRRHHCYILTLTVRFNDSGLLTQEDLFIRAMNNICIYFQLTLNIGKVFITDRQFDVCNPFHKTQTPDHFFSHRFICWQTCDDNFKWPKASMLMSITSSRGSIKYICLAICLSIATPDVSQSTQSAEESSQMKTVKKACVLLTI